MKISKAEYDLLLERLRLLEEDNASLKESEQEHQGFIKARNSRILELEGDVQRLIKTKIRLETRLDARLYSMVLMQGVIRGMDEKAASQDPSRYFKFDEAALRWINLTPDEVALAR